MTEPHFGNQPPSPTKTRKCCKIFQRYAAALGPKNRLPPWQSGFLVRASRVVLGGRCLLIKPLAGGGFLPESCLAVGSLLSTT